MELRGTLGNFEENLVTPGILEKMVEVMGALGK